MREPLHPAIPFQGVYVHECERYHEAKPPSLQEPPAARTYEVDSFFERDDEEEKKKQRTKKTSAEFKRCEVDILIRIALREIEI